MHLLGSLLGDPVTALVHHYARHAEADYGGVLLAAAASWFAVPGLGEAALIAAGVAAAHGRLSLAAVLAVAWLGASAGGTAGWLVGLKGGRELLTAPGPLLRLRLGVIARGERFYERFGLAAVLLAPSWAAGIHDMRGSRFLPANAIAALAWALAIGGGAYLLGPAIGDIVADVGLAGAAIAGVLLVLAVVLVLRIAAASAR